jgi:hypothetical protein
VSNLEISEEADGTVRGTWDGKPFVGKRTGLGQAGWELETTDKGKYRVTLEASHAGKVGNLSFDVTAAGKRPSRAGRSCPPIPRGNERNP